MVGQPLRSLVGLTADTIAFHPSPDRGWGVACPMTLGLVAKQYSIFPIETLVKLLRLGNQAIGGRHQVGR